MTFTSSASFFPHTLSTGVEPGSYTDHLQHAECALTVPLVGSLGTGVQKFTSKGPCGYEQREGGLDLFMCLKWISFI